MHRMLIGWAGYPVLVRLVLFFVLLGVLWLPLAVPLYVLTGGGQLSGQLAVVSLYALLFVALYVWGRWVRAQLAPFKAYGLIWRGRAAQELGLGISFALLSLAGLFALEGSLGWLKFAVPPVVNWAGVGLNSVAVGLGVALAEELLFRGWLAGELARDYGTAGALLGSSVIYALLHFIKPIQAILESWPQFPGLCLLGLILICARLAGQGRLALPIGLHAGWVGSITAVNIVGLVHYTGAVPPLVTGIGNNPLAGLMGLSFLALILMLVLTRLALQGQDLHRAGQRLIS
ncbi:CPBP family intramembrane glutamic endopeptidase [Leptolyngbya sp. FACHB-261]|uniref:CPBP family intramembrane glutamic endopeptidase n=1 Tax=Leptolyngbya sp. FACHB-261 TaxID=2692806 RepID=UPI0016894223|nr:CPBP family intramembrane glutamic endopeptidase [Leptolyngbya sp. FACHB-261]MBD2104724.1 CPBP family intramembrane metalloprotease [Leptolyngbya sp. FACHB-261]